MALVTLLAATQAVAVARHALRGEAPPTGLGPSAPLATPQPAERGLAPYEGVGAWVDVYDVGGGGARGGGAGGGGARPPVTPTDVDAMAVAGVRTLYLQPARDDGTGPAGLDAPGLAASFLVRAHQRGMRVVGWYVPRFADLDRDLAHLRAIARFEARGHRFDGVAVDIEWTGSVADHDERSARLVELSRRLRAEMGDDPVGAIVLPPVQLEVVNPDYWPGFPWDQLAPLYDAWLPMGYWTERSVASGYRDAATYTTENLRLLRDRVGDRARVHAIGGLGESSLGPDLAGFVASVDRDGAIGASIYDWATFPAAAQASLAAALALARVG
jgi:hypothetical protein